MEFGELAHFPRSWLGLAWSIVEALPAMWSLTKLFNSHQSLKAVTDSEDRCGCIPIKFYLQKPWKRQELLTFATKWKELDVITISETKQTQRQILCFLSEVEVNISIV